MLQHPHSPAVSSSSYPSISPVTYQTPPSHLPSPQPPPLPPATPHRSLSAEQTASFPFPSLLSPLTPCSHAPLSRAAAVHKYINLLSACTCVRTWRRRRWGVGAQTAGRPPGGRALYCVPSQMLDVLRIGPIPPAASRGPVVLPPPPSLWRQPDKGPGG